MENELVQRIAINHTDPHEITAATSSGGTTWTDDYPFRTIAQAVAHAYPTEDGQMGIVTVDGREYRL